MARGCEDKQLDERAVLLIRQKCTQHPCTGDPDCSHENHRRDVDYLQECLRMVGLGTYVPAALVTERERRPAA